jgi:hypothetical protein
MPVIIIEKPAFWRPEEERRGCVLAGEVGLACWYGYARARRLAGLRRVSQAYRVWPVFACRAKHHDIY